MNMNYNILFLRLLDDYKLFVLFLFIKRIQMFQMIFNHLAEALPTDLAVLIVLIALLAFTVMNLNQKYHDQKFQLTWNTKFFKACLSNALFS